MRRRDLISTMGAGTTAGLLLGQSAVAAVDPAESSRPSSLRDPVVGSVDLRQIDVFDTHLHQPAQMTYSQSNEFWNSSFVGPLLPSFDFPERDDLKSALGTAFKAHLDQLPREIGQRNYVARAYGLEPTNANVDAVTSEHIDRDFPAYIRAVYQRERIKGVLLQSDLTEPNRPGSLVPDDLFVWSYVINPLLQPNWAQAIGARSVKDVLASIDSVLETCAANGCVGLKVSIAYYRPLGIERVSPDQAQKSLAAILRNPPTGYRSISEAEETEFNAFAANPVFADSKLNAAFRTYQDFLLKHIYVKSGELGLAIIIHTAVALHPALRLENNNPVGLYEILRDDEIRRVQPNFVLIHSGYPFHDYVACLLSQFPNVYADLSFFANFPGTLEEVLRRFLGIAPSAKIMYGSDSSNPETTAYCSFNIRQALAKVLRDYQSDYGWTDRDCETASRNVLNGNARRVFRIGS